LKRPSGAAWCSPPLALLQRRQSRARPATDHLVQWLAFGCCTAATLAGVPVLFVLIQVLNAIIWGVVYGYARAATGSVYPPMLLHAAMNLVVILF
jgi:membrane protease YdiL (CAAX protease family)